MSKFLSGGYSLEFRKNRYSGDVCLLDYISCEFIYRYTRSLDGTDKNKLALASGMVGSLRSILYGRG